MRIIFFGEDSFSATVLSSLLKNGYQVIMVATIKYENFIYKRLEQISQKNNIPFFREDNINSSRFIDTVLTFEPDIIVTAHFQRLLSKELIAAAKIACINLHPSLLPFYRGMAPQHWPIINGESETGITVHYIEEGIDTGNIIVQKRVPIPPNAYVSDLQMSMLPLYDTIVVDALRKIENGEGGGEKQDINEGSFYGRFKRRDAGLDSSTKKADAYNRIRALSKPYMGAFFGNYKLWRARKVNEQEEQELMERFGSTGVHFDDGGKCYLKLQDGILVIDSFEIIEQI